VSKVILVLAVFVEVAALPALVAVPAVPAEVAVVADPALPALVAVPAVPADVAVVAEPAEPAVTDVPAEPAFVAVPAVPAEVAVVAEPAEPAVTEVPAVPADVAVVALPANVVAVIILLPIVIPEPVDSCVLPDAVLRTVPTRYLVAVEASVLTKAADVAVPVILDVHPNAAEPFVNRTWLAAPSAIGKVKVTFAEDEPALKPV
jgi:hypothetical protein